MFVLAESYFTWSRLQETDEQVSVFFPILYQRWDKEIDASMTCVITSIRCNGPVL